MKYLNLYINYLKYEKSYSDNTILNYEKDIEEFISINKDILNIKYKDIKDYLIELNSNKLSKSSISRKLCSLRNFYKYLVKQNIVSNNPFNMVHNPKLDFKLPNYLDNSELDKIFEYSNNDKMYLRDKLIIELLFDTGIRVSEAVHIKLSDINGNNIKIFGKGSKERIVYFGEYFNDLFNKYLVFRNKLVGNKHEYLLINSRGDKISDRGIRLIIDKICTKCNLNKHYSPHSLRHSFATSMLECGADITTVKELLGHSSTASTSIYTHVTNERLRNVYLKNHPRARK